jgi:hypothetical protein
LSGRDCIAVMQSTESRQRNNVVTTQGRWRRNPAAGSILRKSEMSPVLVVITDVVIQQPSQMSAIQYDHMIQEISTYTTLSLVRMERRLIPLLR